MCIVQGSRVWVPRSNGTETKAIVDKIVPACPMFSDEPDMAHCIWDELIPSNVLYPMAHAQLANPVVRMVKATKVKWVPLASLRLVCNT